MSSIDITKAIVSLSLRVVLLVVFSPLRPDQSSSPKSDQAVLLRPVPLSWNRNLRRGPLQERTAERSAWTAISEWEAASLSMEKARRQ